MEPDDKQPPQAFCDPINSQRTAAAIQRNRDEHAARKEFMEHVKLRARGWVCHCRHCLKTQPHAESKENG